MARFYKLLAKLKGLNEALARYPLTAAFLLAAAVVNAVAIETNKDFLKYLMTFVVGAFLGAVAQGIYERFGKTKPARMFFLVAAVLLTAGYYLIIFPVPQLGEEVRIRTVVTLFALLIAFIWLPVVKSRIYFHESFMAVFKSLFLSLFYSGVLFLGVGLIITAIDQLLFRVADTAYIQSANLIFVLFAPVYFLSLIPLYTGKMKNLGQEEEEKIQKAVSCPRFLEILISYIIIPLASVFTVILVIYILINIKGEFWTNNLLEPMLVAYSITVILVYILASRLENKFALYFRRFFPKLLIPIVIFQIISSILNSTQTGLTYSRYYVILYGLFAAATGFVFSLLPVSKNGIVAAILIAFSLFSIVPPMDAFTVSRISQENMLKNVLIKNGMLDNNAITPNPSVSDEDKTKITAAASYLDRMGYDEKIDWLPDDVDFYDTFGFYQYEQVRDINPSVYLTLEPQTVMDISGQHRFLLTDLYFSAGSIKNKICDITKSGKQYALYRTGTSDDCILFLEEEDGKELLRYSTKEIFKSLEQYGFEKSMISIDQATFFKENDRAKITLVVQNAQIEKMQPETNYHADVYLFIQIKE